jgi:hypothetical protein
VPVTRDCLSIALKLVDWRAKCAVGQKSARVEPVEKMWKTEIVDCTRKDMQGNQVEYISEQVA